MRMDFVLLYNLPIHSCHVLPLFLLSLPPSPPPSLSPSPSSPCSLSLPPLPFSLSPSLLSPSLLFFLFPSLSRLLAS